MGKDKKKIEEKTLTAQDESLQEADVVKTEMSKKELKMQRRKEKEAAEIAKEEAKEAKNKDKKAQRKAAKLAKKEAKKLKALNTNRPKWVKKFFKKQQGKPQDYINKYLAKDQERLLGRMRALLNLEADEYQKLFFIKMPSAAHQKSNVKYRLSVDKNGVQTLLYDQAFINVLCFGEDTLYNYQAQIDYYTGRITDEVTTTFRYFDIVTLDTKLGLDNNEKPKYSQFSLSLSLTNGRHVKLDLRNHRLNDAYDLQSVLTQQEERILSLLKLKMQK